MSELLGFTHRTQRFSFFCFTQSSQRTRRFFFFGTHRDIGHIGFRVLFFKNGFYTEGSYF
jgi:hypothetical protein